MPLNPELLKEQIKAAFDAQKTKTANPDEAINSLSEMIATAIHTYVSAAQVAAGIPVATAGSPTAQVGATTATGVLL